MAEVVDLLRRQGVAAERITRTRRIPVQVFSVTKLTVDSLFEGHRPITVEGRWSPTMNDSTITRGWFLIRTNQALGVLAGYLLEPTSEDGVVTWNLLDRELRPGSPYPIVRVEGVLVPGVAVP
jgi:dipeptidyl-peptidase-4